MNNFQRINFAGRVFMYGAKSQLKNQKWTIEFATAVGIMQGLKYGGSLKRGVVAGVAVAGAIAAANGISNVLGCWDEIAKL